MKIDKLFKIALNLSHIQQAETAQENSTFQQQQIFGFEQMILRLHGGLDKPLGCPDGCQHVFFLHGQIIGHIALILLGLRVLGCVGMHSGPVNVTKKGEKDYVVGINRDERKLHNCSNT